MRKLIALFVTVLLATSAHAQFTLTKEGFVSSQQPGKNYYVKDFPIKSQGALYRKAMLYFGALKLQYRDMKINTIGKDMITIEARIPGAISVYGGFDDPFDLAFGMAFRFADNKVRIDAPEIMAINRGNNYIVVYDVDYAKLNARHKLSNHGRHGKDEDKDEGISVARIFRQGGKKDGKLKLPKVKNSLENYINDFANKALVAFDAAADSYNW